MKNLLILLVLSFLFTMCQNKQKAIESAQMQNDSLQLLINQKDSSLYTFLNTFNTIENNLQTIKDQEGIISTLAIDNTESFQNREEQINDDIQVIYGLMVENKEALSKLEKQLAQSKTNEKKLKQIIATLNNKLLEKDGEILELQRKLKEMNIQVTQLTYAIDTLEVENQKSKETIAIQDATLKTAYYIIGTSKELKDMGILDKSGLFSNKGVNSDFDKTRFTQVSILTDTLIQLDCKKINLITTHPGESYNVNQSTTIESISIIDPWDFWSVSKYLVVVIK